MSNFPLCVYICVQFQLCVLYTVASVEKRVTQKELALHEQAYIQSHIDSNLLWSVHYACGCGIANDKTISLRTITIHFLKLYFFKSRN